MIIIILHLTFIASVLLSGANQWLEYVGLALAYSMSFCFFMIASFSSSSFFKENSILNYYVLLIHSLALTYMDWKISFSVYTVTVLLLILRKVRADG